MPMFSFDKSSYESKLVDVLQDKFFNTARRNKIVAKWAGGRLGFSGTALTKYVRKIIFGYILIPNDRIMVEKILNDFKNAKIQMTADTIYQKLKSVEIRIRNRTRMNKNAS